MSTMKSMAYSSQQQATRYSSIALLLLLLRLLLFCCFVNINHGFLTQQQNSPRYNHVAIKRNDAFIIQSTTTTQQQQQLRLSIRQQQSPIRLTSNLQHSHAKTFDKHRKRRQFAAATSPLFSSTTPITTTTSTSSELPSSPTTRLQRFFLSIQNKKRRWLLPTLAVLLLPRWVGRKSLQSLNYVLETIPWKPLARVVIVVWVAVSIMSTVHTNRRQAQDATSEWSRYAEKPGARGRAILWLLVQQAVYILASRVTATLLGAKQTAANIRAAAGHDFSNGLLKLGPLYIKLGQIVSCRKGLLGKEWIDAMADLQDRVPARTGQDALDLAYATLQGGKKDFDELFVEFDSTPLAAASLGQVHRAKLRSNNDDVAVKIQRPYLRQIYDQDFVLLTTIAQFMDRLPGTSKNVGGVASSWTQIFEDAEDILYREIDYRDEAENAMRFANDFGLGLGGNATQPTALSRNNKTLPSAADWLRTPYVYSNVSNERLLVMEYVPSIKITNRAKLDAANVTEEDRIELADNLARAYLRQFCCNLFFSTDPHPGNLGVEMVPASQLAGGGGNNNIVKKNIDKVANGILDDPPKPRLVMYDFGQAATLNRNQADGILEIIEAIVDTDVDRSVEAFQKMGVLVDGANLDEVREKVAENYRTGKVKANRKKLRRKGFKFRDEDENPTASSTVNVTASTSSLVDGTTPVSATAAEISAKSAGGSDAKVMSYFSLPAEYAFVARAISQMDGVGKSLDPEFDFISSAAPYLVEIKGADLYVKEEIAKFFRGLQGKWLRFQEETLPNWWNKVTGSKR